MLSREQPWQYETSGTATRTDFAIKNLVQEQGQVHIYCTCTLNGPCSALLE